MGWYRQEYNCQLTEKDLWRRSTISEAANLPISLAFVKIWVITWGSMTSLALATTAAAEEERSQNTDTGASHTSLAGE